MGLQKIARPVLDKMNWNERMSFMAMRIEAAFRVADMPEPLWRPLDHMPWQMDICFVRAIRPEFLQKSYE